MVRLTRWFALVGFIALGAMIVVTCIDIVLRLLSRLPGRIGRFIPLRAGHGRLRRAA
jgi:hypothetical protein